MFKDKTVIVTGGSRGIGRSIAEAFALEGARIALIYSGSHEAALQVQAGITQGGGRCEIYQCNVADYEKTAKIVAEIKAQFGSIDVLINNAGIVRDKLVLAMKEEDFDQVIDVNLKGAFNMIKHVYPIMAKQRSGKIISMSSIVGLNGNKGQANYSASKAGIIGLTKSVAKELASRGVTVNAIAPGYIATEMTDSLSDKVQEEIINAIPMKRKGTTEDIANLTLFLASDKAAYITGQVIVVDGGMSV